MIIRTYRNLRYNYSRQFRVPIITARVCTSAFLPPFPLSSSLSCICYVLRPGTFFPSLDRGSSSRKRSPANDILSPLLWLASWLIIQNDRSLPRCIMPRCAIHARVGTIRGHPGGRMESGRACVTADTVHRLRGGAEGRGGVGARENHFELHSGEAIPSPTAWRIVRTSSSYYEDHARRRVQPPGVDWPRSRSTILAERD